MEDLSLQELIQRCCNQDKNAFQELYQRYYKKAYYIALKISRNQADAKDIAQDTFIQIQKSLKNLKDPTLFEQWFHRIIISKASDLFRKNKTTSFPDDHAVFLKSKEDREYMIPESTIHYTTDQEMIRSFIDRLDDKYRIVLLLSYFSNLKIKEISAVLDIPEGTVKSRMNTGKEQLKQMILQYEQQEQTSLNFNSAEIATILTALFIAEFTSIQVNSIGLITSMSLKSKLLSLFHQPSTYLCLSLVGVITYSSMQIYEITQSSSAHDNISNQSVMLESRKQFGPIIYAGNSYDNPEDAYYALTLWAHCEVEMKEKTRDEIIEIKPLYDELKKYQGVYWQLLIFHEWNTQFENFM